MTQLRGRMQSGPKGGELTPIARGPEGQRARANVFLPNPRARDDSQDAQFARLQSMLDEDDAEKPKGGKPKAERPPEEEEEHSEEDSLLQRGWSSASTGEPEHPDCRTTLRLSSKPPPTKLSESKVLAKLAWPMSATFCLQQGAQQVNIMFVGHLGAKQLGAVVLATMWANVSGTSICMGGMTALDSLAAQAFGAEKYELVGVLLQRCLAIITLLCIPIFFVWWIGTRLVLEMLGIERESSNTSAWVLLLRDF